MAAFIQQTVDDDENPKRDHGKAQKGQVGDDQVIYQPKDGVKNPRAEKRYGKKKDAK